MTIKSSQDFDKVKLNACDLPRHHSLQGTWVWAHISAAKTAHYDTSVWKSQRNKIKSGIWFDVCGNNRVQGQKKTDLCELCSFVLKTGTAWDAEAFEFASLCLHIFGFIFVLKCHLDNSTWWSEVVHHIPAQNKRKQWLIIKYNYLCFCWFWST